MLVEYNGTEFCGNQYQDNGPTVQQAMEIALERLNIPMHGRVCFAGRTDAGVHAQGQVAHVDVPMGVLDRYPQLLISLNHFLPASIAVRQVAITQDLRFHSTVSAQWRWYHYRIFDAPTRSVWCPPNAAWIRPIVAEKFDEQHFHEALQALVGVHVVKAFGCHKKERSDVVVALPILRAYRDEAGLLAIDLVGNRFMYKMVRSIVGTLVDLAQSQQLTAQEMRRILRAQHRPEAGPTAPAQGLSLQGVVYPAPWDFFKNDVYVKKVSHQLQELSSS